MTSFKPINLAVEDALSEAILRVILKQSRGNYFVGSCFSQGGSGNLKRKIPAFNNAAKGTPFFVLTDLNEYECPPVLMQEWLSMPKHPNLFFRVAVREVESWLLAHRDALSKYLGIRREQIPLEVDNIINPKQLLIKLARKSRYRNKREAIVPAPGSTAKVGPNYNGCLISFVTKNWNVPVAMRFSPSLKGTVSAVNNFSPVWKSNAGRLKP